MDKNEVKTYPQPYNSLEQFIKDGCSLNQMQLEKELEWAERKAKENHFLPNGQPEEGWSMQDGFQDMLAKLKERGITPRVIEDFGKESQRIFRCGNFWQIRAIFEKETEDSSNFAEESEKLKESKSKRKEYGKAKKNYPAILKTTGTIAACFAVAAVVFLLKPGLDVVGRREYEYHSKIRNEEKGDIVWNNQEDYITDLSHLEYAYQEIKDKLGINVLKLNYIPGDIVLSKVTIEDRHARLEFVKQDNFLYVLEVMYPVDDSANRFSDRVTYKKIYNEWMGKWIFVQKNQLEDDVAEYNAYFEHENAYYYLQGIIEEDVFIHILEDLTLEINQ